MSGKALFKAARGSHTRSPWVPDANPRPTQQQTTAYSEGNMYEYTNFYINGKWVRPSVEKTLEVINPATEQPMGIIFLGNAADVDKAVAAAKAAFTSFSQTTREQRIALLEAIIAEYQKRLGDLATAISAEMGAPKGLATAAQA